MLKDMFQEFKEFLLRGNVVDLAVGVVVGAAFGSVVTSLVRDILTPLIAAIGGQPDFSKFKLTVHNSDVLYGSFINALIAFLIIATVIFFFVIKPMNHLISRANRGKENTPDTRNCPECLSVIPKKATRCSMCTAKVAATA